MKKCNDWRFLLAMVCIAAVLTACRSGKTAPLFDLETHSGERTKAQPVVILLTHSESENSLTHELALNFKEKLETASQGQIQVEIYPNDTLGTLSDGVEAFGNGSVEMRVGAGPSKALQVIRWLPALQAVKLSDLEVALREGGTIREILEEECRQDRVKMLGIMPPVFRVVTSSRPVYNLADFSGVRMRVVSDGIESRFWQKMGAQTVSFSIKEVYTALQQDIVDAQENTLPSIIGNRFYEQQKYLIITNHKVYMDAVYIDQGFFDSLTEMQRQQISDAVGAAIEEASLRQTDYLLNGYRQMQAAGVSVVSFTDEERQRMREAARPDVESYLNQYCGTQVIQQIKDALQ